MMAEWMLYTVLMEGYVKFYEYTFDSLHQRPKHAENQDFKELHRWRRSSRQSLKKLQSVEAFVLHWQSEDPTGQNSKFLLQDIRHMTKEIEQHRHSLETMVAIMTSVIQLTDSRRSIEEAFNIRRLTYIALIFIPLSFTVSIFSMGGDFIPGKDRFWVYFATAVPLLFVVLCSSILSSWPWKTFKLTWENPNIPFQEAGL
jgi:Mg2+ and Co2+ transporter CorA